MKKGLFVVLLLALSINLNAQDREWKMVETFRGSGITNTAPFTISSNEWKVEYESTASNPVLKGNGHLLQIYLHTLGEDRNQIEIIANQVNKEQIQGESFIYKSGRFYIKANSALGDWVIKVMVPSN